MNTAPRISVTGTKGKTTVVNVIASFLRAAEHDVLHVDTTGHFVNGERRSTLDDSKQIWNLVPSVCPGRYLWEFKTDPKLAASEKAVAVLECALGCSAGAGLGYRRHKVGVFLNVMEDHLGSSPRLKTQADIAKAKSFILHRIEQGGWAVFNAEDQNVVDSLRVIPEARQVHLVACGLDRAKLEPFVADGGVAITQKDNWIVLLSRDGEEQLFDLTAIPWTFGGNFRPSVYNLMHAAGALYGFYDGNLPDNFRKLIEGVRLDHFGGRLTLMQAENGATILADYAHEKYSLREVGKLAKHLTVGPEGRVIGVVRLAYDRTPELIRETGEYIANSFDEFVVYDKVDGYWTKGTKMEGRRFQKVEGYVSQLLTDALKTKNPHVTRILREDEAIAFAATHAGQGDVVVVIVNDDIERSIGFVQKSFRARFL